MADDAKPFFFTFIDCKGPALPGDGTPRPRPSCAVMVRRESIQAVRRQTFEEVIIVLDGMIERQKSGELFGGDPAVTALDYVRRAVADAAIVGLRKGGTDE